jgi:CheY-like chemotaxis protein
MNEPKHALVVDDNQLNSRLVAVFLKRLGWRPHIVDNGDAALSTLGAQAFDLVLLDMRMPQLDGAEVCRRIRHELHLTSLPVVAYTAHSSAEEKQRILASGFSGLLVKPISFIDLRDVCDEFGAASH